MRAPHLIKPCLHGWIMEEITKQAKKRGISHHTNVIMGLMDRRLDESFRDGRDVYYLDHSYFQRGWQKGHFRAVRNACHLNEIKARPDDRMKKFGVEIEPWRKQRGSKIVIIPPYAGHERLWPSIGTWLNQTHQKIQETTDRPIVVKWEKGNLREFLEDAWCVVCNMSVAGLESALMGVPVFSTERCCSWPVNAGPLEKIESPEFPERHDWVTGLTYASWHYEELDNVNWLEYDYTLRNDLS